jgi:hypothetical protein
MSRATNQKTLSIYLHIHYTETQSVTFLKIQSLQIHDIQSKMAFSCFCTSMCITMDYQHLQPTTDNYYQ